MGDLPRLRGGVRQVQGALTLVDLAPKPARTQGSVLRLACKNINARLADAASDTMVSDEEIEPHLAAVDRISVTSSGYHDCLPNTVEEARRQGYPGPGDCPGRGRTGPCDP